ncbi:MAG: DUF1080 domain-containing protein [Acidobacteriota bacterium]
MKPVCLILLAAATLWGQANTLTPQEAAEGWLLLFDGSTLFAWTQEGQWRVQDGAVVGEGAQPGALRTNSTFSDYILKLDFRSPGSATGVFLRTGQEARSGYQLPRRRLKKATEWQSYEVQVSGSQFAVKIDGRKVSDRKHMPNKTGAVALTYEPNAKIEVRNIKLKPLGLKSVFNGKDLAGWRKVESPKPSKQPPVWTVKDGAINVVGGPGQIETETTYADFILQIDIRANQADPARHPNSGVFFRGEPGGYWSGYEAQIRNEYKDGNREAPVDFGTGGIYRYQAARRVVSNDNAFFNMTVSACGRHLATWVNGFPVADITDTNPEGPDVRKKQARLTAGAISLQAHDPTTNLDFKNIRVAELK